MQIIFQKENYIENIYSSTLKQVYIYITNIPTIAYSV